MKAWGLLNLKHVQAYDSYHFLSWWVCNQNWSLISMQRSLNTLLLFCITGFTVHTNSALWIINVQIHKTLKTYSAVKFTTQVAYVKLSKMKTSHQNEIVQNVSMHTVPNHLAHRAWHVLDNFICLTILFADQVTRTWIKIS